MGSCGQGKEYRRSRFSRGICVQWVRDTYLWKPAERFGLEMRLCSHQQLGAGFLEEAGNHGDPVGKGLSGWGRKTSLHGLSWLLNFIPGACLTHSKI